MESNRITTLAVSLLSSLAAAVTPASAQDPFTGSERWNAAPTGAAWMPEAVRFSSDDAFVWVALRGGPHSALLFDSVDGGTASPRGVVSRLTNEFGAAMIATGTNLGAVYCVRQVESPSIYERAPIVDAFDPESASAGAELAPRWRHDLGVTINGPVRIEADDAGDIVACAAWDDTTATTRVDVLDGPTGALLGRIDLAAVSLNALAVSGDGTRVALVCGTTLFVLDGAANLVHQRSLGSSTMALDLSHDGGTIAHGQLGALHVITSMGGAYGAADVVPGTGNELPSAVACSDDGSLLAVAWWDYSNGLDARVEIYDTVFQFALAAKDLPRSQSSFQNLPIAARITSDGHRAAFGLWGNDADPEVHLLDATGTQPAIAIDVNGSVRGLDLDASGTRVAVGHKDVHAQVFGSTGTVLLYDSGERKLQLLETPLVGGSLRAAAKLPGSASGWFILGPKATVPTQFPNATGLLLLRRDRLFVIPRATDADGRMDLDMQLGGNPALIGSQLHLQAAFRVPGGLAFTENLVSPIVLQ